MKTINFNFNLLPHKTGDVLVCSFIKTDDNYVLVYGNCVFTSGDSILLCRSYLVVTRVFRGVYYKEFEYESDAISHAIVEAARYIR